MNTQSLKQCCVPLEWIAGVVIWSLRLPNQFLRYTSIFQVNGTSDSIQTDSFLFYIIFQKKSKLFF